MRIHLPMRDAHHLHIPHMSELCAYSATKWPSLVRISGIDNSSCFDLLCWSPPGGALKRLSLSSFGDMYKFFTTCTPTPDNKCTRRKYIFGLPSRRLDLVGQETISLSLFLLSSSAEALRFASIFQVSWSFPTIEMAYNDWDDDNHFNGRKKIRMGRFFSQDRMVLQRAPQSLSSLVSNPSNLELRHRSERWLWSEFAWRKSF